MNPLALPLIAIASFSPSYRWKLPPTHNSILPVYAQAPAPGAVSSGCYMVNQYGEIINLSSLCGSQSVKEKAKTSPPSSSNQDAGGKGESSEDGAEVPDTQDKGSSPAGGEGDAAAAGNQPNQGSDAKTAEPPAKQEVDPAKLPPVERAIPLIRQQRSPETTQQ